MGSTFEVWVLVRSERTHPRDFGYDWHMTWEGNNFARAIVETVKAKRKHKGYGVKLEWH